jgi:hypothetical protein
MQYEGLVLVKSEENKKSLCVHKLFECLLNLNAEVVDPEAVVIEVESSLNDSLPLHLAG